MSGFLEKVFVGAVLVAVFAAGAQGEILISHTGLNDPTTESPAWGVSMGTGSTTGSGIDTRPYWSINSAIDVQGQYYKSLTASDLSGNWGAKAVVEGVTLSTDPINTCLAVFSGQEYAIGLSTTGLQRITSSKTWESLSAFTPNPSQYYTLQLQKSEAGVNAYLDGVSVGLVPGCTGNYQEFDWGDLTTTDSPSHQGQVSHWNYVGLDSAGFAIPEPSVIVLLSTGAMGLLAYAWRKRRRVLPVA
jgi:hypothetical protein